VYLSDFKLAHKLRNVPCNFSNDFFIYSMLKGAKNLNLYKSIFKPAKFVMSFHLLKILDHEIAVSSWKQDSKNSFLLWAACCLAFFGSFLIGGILPNDLVGKTFKSLTWNRIYFTNRNSTIINIHFPKSQKKLQGDFVDIFKLRTTVAVSIPP
jgi:hypothetical protein